MMTGIAPNDVDRARAAIALSALIGQDLSLKRTGHEYTACCPFHVERSASFTVNDAKRFYHCFGCGAHGDAISWLTQWRGMAFPEAVGFLLGGSTPTQSLPPRARPEPSPSQESDDDRGIAKARSLWAARQPVAGSAVETYWAARGLAGLPLPPTLGFLPDQPYWWQADGWDRPRVIATLPVMIAPIVTLGRAVQGVHLTYLAPDGRGKAQLRCPVSAKALPSKKMRGRHWGGAIRLAPVAHEMGIAEGIETAAAVMLATDGALPCWAAGSLGNLAGGGLGVGEPHPTRRDHHGRPVLLPSTEPDLDRPGMVLPPEVSRVVVLADADGRDPVATRCLVERACRKWGAEGRLVRLAWPELGKDFNDMLQGGSS
jgi:hypothetical protein